MTTLNLLSWNVNGMRAIHKKGFLDWLAQAQADIVCLQETKCEASQLPAEVVQPAGYHAFWHNANSRKGYSGTALLSRTAPLSVQFGLGTPNLTTRAGPSLPSIPPLPCSTATSPTADAITPVCRSKWPFTKPF